MLGDNPYTPTQLLNYAIRLLLGCGCSHHDFEELDCKPVAKKIWTKLKPFIQEAYQQHLNATSNTAGQHKYVQNAFGTLAKDSGNNNADAQMVIT
jgi:hypothetical protein